MIGVSKYKELSKWEKHEVKQKFIREFASGKHSVESLAKKYNVHRERVLKWKHQHFGKGSLKQKRMYQMRMSDIPTRVIAEFYGVSNIAVSKAIRDYKIKMTN